MSKYDHARKLCTGIACANCPFRFGSEFVYDDDAMEALNGGWEPSCHQIVGMQSIFHDSFPTATRCSGYDAWLRGDAGFSVPGGVNNRPG